MPTPAVRSPGDSTVIGPPLDTIADRIAGPHVDDLLRRAARRAPDRVALRTGADELTYAELDERVDRCAAALQKLLGDGGATVAVATVLSPVFPIAYYGIVRGGFVAATVNPLLRQEALQHLLRGSRARAAILTPTVYAAIDPVRHLLPDLTTVVLTEAVPDRPELPVVADLLAAADGPPTSRADEPDAIANVLFTSGTTGAPKAVALSHRNLTVNAAQTALTHGLSDDSVMFNYLPTYHLMHLNIAVQSAATQVLWTDPDVPASIDAAAEHGATHYYSLPMRLNRLAAHPGLAAMKVPTLRAVLSGGSALPASATVRLSEHFGVPVVQGYGLAEASPQTHFDDLADPRPGSCGRPAVGTEARIVHVDTRVVLPPGERGELQVRGPQLMHGYVGEAPGAHLDADGWFTTGDVGYADPQGRLFIVDRIKDVFKCDNFLVAPTEVERLLQRHPAVADCVVVDYPDPLSGAVAYALVVLGDPASDVAAAVDVVNRDMPYYQQVRYVETVDRIPRSPTGKIQRRELRQAVHARTVAAPTRPAAEGAVLPVIVVSAPDAAPAGR
jgi:long-chain acyl-CoA synthetase